MSDRKTLSLKRPTLVVEDIISNRAFGFRIGKTSNNIAENFSSNQYEIRMYGDEKLQTLVMTLTEGNGILKVNNQITVTRNNTQNTLVNGTYYGELIELMDSETTYRELNLIFEVD